MRSRYTAYTQANIDYIARTHAPESRASFDAAAARTWAERAKWLGLRIISTNRGVGDDRDGVVEFIATYKQNGATIAHHELSLFRKTEKGEWLFVQGAAPDSKEGEGLPNPPSRLEKSRPVVRETKVGRNDSCLCGSGKKYKKCCGA